MTIRVRVRFSFRLIARSEHTEVYRDVVGLYPPPLMFFPERDRIHLSVRMLWLQSMHACSAIHNALSEMTEHKHVTSDQHEEMGKSRMQRDYSDLQKVLEWFETSNPFDVNRKHLQSL